MEEGNVAVRLARTPDGRETRYRDVSEVGENGSRVPGFYRLESNHSSASIFEDVEMAHDEVGSSTPARLITLLDSDSFLQLYSGPMAESLPTSVSTFNHRRARADSTTSFSFYQEGQDDEDAPILGRGHVDDLDELPFDDDVDEMDDEDSSTELQRRAADNDYVLHRRASTQSRGSIHSHLLRRESAVSAGSGYGGGNRSSQKIYMENEDLYIAIAGFSTSSVGLAAYAAICVCTVGVGWLVFRWIPRWHVKLVGRSAPLRDCQWVVIEVSLPVLFY